MSLAQLPPLKFEGGLRISLFPRSDSPLFPRDSVTGEVKVLSSSDDKIEDAPVETESQPQIPERRRPRRDTGEGHIAQEDSRPQSSQHEEAVGSQPRLERRAQHQRDASKSSIAQSIASEITASDFDEPRQTASAGPTIPIHPIASMQEAFEESLHEVTTGTGALKPKLREFDAKQRREKLLEQDKVDEAYDALWRYRPGQDQHEMLKLLAQISFGVYLLLNGMANSNSQVVTILQGHIDEVDEFLEVALEDLTQASIDLNGRIDYLKLPMSNMKIFEELLEDREFRSEILEGNEKIDHILARTNVALRQWDDDIEAGMTCTAAFRDWLKEQDSAAWKKDRPEVLDIYEAMMGNAEGWQNAFDEMNQKAHEMNNLIIKLMTIVAEMEKKAGEISRKTWAQIPPFTVPTTGGDKSSTTSPHSPRSNMGGSIRSADSISTMQAPRSERAIDNDSIFEYQLPGGAPLLPPPRMSTQSPLRSPASGTGTGLRIQTQSPKSPRPPVQQPPPRKTPSMYLNDTSNRAELADNEVGSGNEEEPLYILQPRVYTPQPPASPVTHQSPTSQHSSPLRFRESIAEQSGQLKKQTSLRQRVSQKGNPPSSIRIPSRQMTESQSFPQHGNTLSPRSTTPRTGVSFAQDATYGPGSGSDPNPPYRQQISRVASHSDLAPPVRPSLMPSPRSDHQFYRPVMASPHSPLQQRPHTSGTGAAAAPLQHEISHRTSQYQQQHIRNQPSRLGGMSMLNNVTTAGDGYHNNDDTRTIATQRTAGRTERTLKKKKSAFGWLKKAFSMDEEEKAAFEAKKQMQLDPAYYTDQSPKFLDGRRIR